MGEGEEEWKRGRIIKKKWKREKNSEKEGELKPRKWEWERNSEKGRIIKTQNKNKWKKERDRSNVDSKEL
jgi:hypothetical protein